MNTSLPYVVGKAAALRKIGMDLTFNSPQAAKQHAETKQTISDVAGFGGSLAGGTAGGAIGTAVGGPVGSMAGGIGGSMIGEKAVSFPVQTAVDMSHDVGQRTNSAYNRAMSQMNAASGAPPGVR